MMNPEIDPDEDSDDSDLDEADVAIDAAATGLHREATASGATVSVVDDNDVTERALESGR